MRIPAAKAAVDQEWEKLEKIPAWDLTKVRSEEEVIDESRTKGAKVHFASLMDICHLKNAELEAKHQKYKGRVVLCGDIVKDDSGSYAVFIEQGYQHHKWQQQRSWISYPDCQGCDGQAADAVSAYTQVKMEDAHKLLKIPKSECPDIWIRLPRHKWPISWSSMEDPVDLLERNLYGHPLAGLPWERQLEKILLKYGWEKVSNCECLFVHGGKEKQWSVVESTQQRSWFGSTNIFPRSCISGMYSKTMWNEQRYCGQYRTMFESRISAGGLEKLPFPHNLRISSWSYDMEGHSKKCVERYCELANKTTQQLYKVSTPCIDDHHFKEWIEICRRIVKKYLLKLACTWHVLEDLIFHGQWTNLNDRSRNGPKPVTNDWIVWHLTSITHVNINTIVMWVRLQNNAGWDCF